MAIKYDKLFERMKETNTSEYFLRSSGISPSVFTKLRHGTGGLDARTIDKLCRLLDCQPGDLMEYVPDLPLDIDLDAMSPREFEIFVATLLRQLGFSVTVPISNLGRTDLQAEKDGVIYGVECKLSKTMVGIDVVLRTWNCTVELGWDHAMVVTNTAFTPEAKRTAERLHVILWDRNTILNRIVTLKECNPANGSAAFLMEAVNYIEKSRALEKPPLD